MMGSLLIPSLIGERGLQAPSHHERGFQCNFEGGIGAKSSEKVRAEARDCKFGGETKFLHGSVLKSHRASGVSC